MIKIVTDSSSLFTIEEGRKKGIEALPLCVNIGDHDYRDLQVDMEEFYGLIAKGHVPTSSQPPIGDVLEAYETFQDCQIINITMAEGLSGTYETACAAKEMMERSDHITVFNSRTLCGPHRYMVEQSQKMVEEGASYDQIMIFLEYAANHQESFLIPQDFSFLKRGGRLTPLAAAFGSILRLKPIMIQTRDGKRLDKFDVGRTLSSAMKNIIKHMRGKFIDSSYICYVSHANALADAKKVQALLEAAFENIEIRMMPLSAAFVTQGGPKCIAVQYIKR